jgi:2,5-furandicarboxylate decarboxylase 1
VVFENVKNMKSSPSAFPLLYNLFATRSLCASAIGLPPTADRMELTHELSRLEREAGSTTVVPAREAPVKQNVLTREKADLRCLPIGMHHKLDVGPYLTMICVMKSPKGGFYDMTFTKNMVKSRQRMSISTHAHHHLDLILREHEQEQRRAPVAIVLGHHPAYSL